MRAWLSIVAMLGSAAASAHEVGLSRGTWVQDPTGVTAELVFSGNELRKQHLDAEGIVSDVNVETNGVVCPGHLIGEQDTDADGHAVRAVFTCANPGRTTVDLSRLFAHVSPGHRHIGHAATATTAIDVVVYQHNAAFSFGEAPRTPPLLAYVRIGIEHILTGFDHLVFLFGLVLIGGRWRALLAVVTAFTAAHSISLALAVLGVVNPAPAVIEPLIALSIAYVGVENFFVKDANKRWRITAPFGLVHGFGFAGALREVGVPKDAVAPALVLFNVGVELGQLAVLVVLLPMLLLLRHNVARFDPVGKNIMSALVLLAGLVWFVQRVFF